MVYELWLQQIFPRALQRMQHSYAWIYNLQPIMSNLLSPPHTTGCFRLLILQSTSQHALPLEQHFSPLTVSRHYPRCLVMRSRIGKSDEPGREKNDMQDRSVDFRIRSCLFFLAMARQRHKMNIATVLSKPHLLTTKTTGKYKLPCWRKCFGGC